METSGRAPGGSCLWGHQYLAATTRHLIGVFRGAAVMRIGNMTTNLSMTMSLVRVQDGLSAQTLGVYGEF